MSAALAMDGGPPIRTRLLPYGSHWIDDDDIAAVTATLRSGWLTTGPQVETLERQLAHLTRSTTAVAVSSGTAALHAALFALGIGPGDEVIVPPLTFAASVNCILYRRAIPVFADVDPDTLLLDPACAAARIGACTRAIIAVDYAGQPCDYAALREATGGRPVRLIADACHALGGADGGQPVGTLADLSAFSFHPVKVIAAGEGGAVTTDNPNWARRMQVFRNHGITTETRARQAAGAWFYEMTELGFNFRLSDIHCALAGSQLSKVPAWIRRRQDIAARYDAAFADTDSLRPLRRRPGVSHAFHLYVVRLDTARLRADRNTVFRALRAEGIGVNVHYIPVHLHPYYRRHLSTGPGLCPVAERSYECLLTLPLFPRMSESDVDDVIAAVHKVTGHFRR